MKRLRVPPLDQKAKDYPRGVVFRVGLFTGMCIISLTGTVLETIPDPIGEFWKNFEKMVKNFSKFSKRDTSTEFSKKMVHVLSIKF